MVFYLTYMAEFFSIAADIVGKENTTASQTLRMLAAAKHVQADRMLKLMQRDFQSQKRPEIPVPITSDNTLHEALNRIKMAIASEIELSQANDSYYNLNSRSTEWTLRGILSCSDTTAMLLRDIVDRLQASDQEGPYFCTNCLQQHDTLPTKTGCDCGVSAAWCRPLGYPAA